MMLIDEKIAWPINHTTVKCYKLQNHCTLDQIRFNLPDDKSWSQKYGVIEDSTEYYDISDWEQDNIDAAPEKVPDACRTTSMNLNFKTKEFFFITRNAGGNCEIPGLLKYDQLPKPRIAQIVDGSKIINDEFAQIEKATYEVLSSDFKKKIDALNIKEERDAPR